MFTLIKKTSVSEDTEACKQSKNDAILGRIYTVKIPAVFGALKQNIRFRPVCQVFYLHGINTPLKKPVLPARFLRFPPYFPVGLMQ